MHNKAGKTFLLKKNFKGGTMKKRRNVLMCIFVLSIILVCTSCTSTSQGSKTYTRTQAQSALTVYYGTVLNVADVNIQTETKDAVGGI